jgi:hypothetical protein
LKNNYFGFCNASPKSESSLAIAGEENILLHTTTNSPSQINHVEMVSFDFKLEAVDKNADDNEAIEAKANETNKAIKANETNEANKADKADVAK